MWRIPHENERSCLLPMSEQGSNRQIERVLASTILFCTVLGTGVVCCALCIMTATCNHHDLSNHKLGLSTFGLSTCGLSTLGLKQGHSCSTTGHCPPRCAILLDMAVCIWEGSVLQWCWPHTM